MRKIVWFAVGFSLACILCAAVFHSQEMVPFLVLSVFPGILCTYLGKRRELLKKASLVLLGISAGASCFLLTENVYIRPLTGMDGETVHLSVTASNYSERTRYSWAFEGVTQLHGMPYKVLVYLKDDTVFSPGDTMESDFRVCLTTPGGIKESAYHQGNASFLIASQKGEAVCYHTERTPIWCIPAVIARSVTDHLETCFPQDTLAFAKALLLGDTDDLTYEEDTALKISGIRHVAAVSGLHVSFLFGLIYFLCGKKRKLTILIAAPVLFLFAAVTGFTPSVIRACIMTGFMALGAALMKDYDGLTGLSVAVLLMLSINPYMVNSVSFQLSVLSVLGILLFASPIFEWFRNLFPEFKGKSIPGRLIRWIGGSVCVSVSASLITTPLSAYYFGTVSLISPLTNLLVLWAIGIAFCGIGIVGVFGGVAVSLCRFLAGLVSWLLRYVLTIAAAMSAIPYAAVYTQSSFIVAWLVMCYVLIGIYLIAGRKHLGRYLALGCIGLLTAIGLSVFLPKLDDVRLTVMDVGEGQCILLQSGGSNYLIDCGGDTDTKAADTAAQTLLSQGVRRLDGIILTHGDYDHADGVQYLLSRVKADRIYLSAADSSQALWTLNQKFPDKITLITENTQLPINYGMLTITEPGNLKSSNENCICVLFESDKCVILITGDRGRSGEKQLLKSMELPDVDILIAGHHGSKNSTSRELLDAVTPEIAVISVGKKNSYGHPTQEVLDRLAESGCTVYRTDLQGTVLVRR